jgi:hypothetical protein
MNIYCFSLFLTPVSLCLTTPLIPHIYLYPDPVKSSKSSRIHNTLPNKENAVKPSPYLVNPQQIL